MKLIVGKNDLATTHPEIAKEADGWDPTSVTSGIDKKLQWKCPKGHAYISRVDHRNAGSGCPFCSGNRVLSGFNDLATTNPDLAKEADGWDPTIVIAGSNKKLQWKCSKNHSWKSTSNNRSQGSGCPFCSGNRVLSGFNDLATTNPDLAKEADGWDPTIVNAGSNKKLQWKCSKNHSWKSTVFSRREGSGCPVCDNQKILVGYNDLATTNPDLAKEADGWDTRKVIAGTHRKLNWKCSEGHKWMATGSHRVRGQGCPSCAVTGFDPNKDAHLYFLIQPTWEIFQIGITNFPKDRLQSHKRNGFELLDLRGPMDGHTAQELETAILRFLKSQKADLSPEHIAGKFDGYSESWTIDSFKVNNLKELIDKANEAGY
jgi:hypothetical protein